MEISSHNFFINLLSIAADFYLYVLLIRFFLQKLQGPYYNPLSQFVVRITEPMLKPFQHIAPIYHHIDTSILLLAFLIQLFMHTLVLSTRFSMIPHFLGLLLLTIVSLTAKVINIFFFAILFSAVISWFPALRNSPITAIVECFASPLLYRVHRFIPLVGGIDLSPLIVLFGLKLVSILVLYPLFRSGLMLAL